MAKTLCFASVKGGVAKSVSCMYTGSCLALDGRKVLFIDMDPQANLTHALLGDYESDLPTIYEVLKREADIIDAIQHTDAGDIVAGSLALVGADLEFNFTGREYRLREALETCADDYDYVMIDTSCYLGCTTIMALAASDHVIIPCEPTKWAGEGMLILLKTFVDIKKYVNPDITIAGILPTMADLRTNSSKYNLSELKEICDSLGLTLFESRIRRSTKVQDALNEGVNLVFAAPNCRPSLDYRIFTNELLERI